MTLQHSASPSGVAPYATKLRRSTGSTSRADVCANHCAARLPDLQVRQPREQCAPMRAPTVSLASRPVRGHAAWWSPRKRRRRHRNRAHVRRIGVERPARQPQLLPQRDQHAVGRQSGVSLTRGGACTPG